MLYQHTSLPPLLAHLEPHLPTSLPSFNTLLLPNPDVSYWCTFAPSSSLPPKDEPWVLLAYFEGSTQLRPFCSFESEGDGQWSEEKQKRGREVLLQAMREWFKALPANRNGPIVIGAVHERWIPMLRRELNPTQVGEYRVHLAPEEKGEGSAELLKRRGCAPLPEGMRLGQAREEDIAEILSTSEVAHPPSYLLNRLAYSTALFLSPSPSSTDPSAKTEQLIASCFTHRDGSLGTLHVSSAYRRRGLARLIVEARERSLAEGESGGGDGETGGQGQGEESGGERRVRGFAYVGRGNVESRALMSALGWREEWGVAWIRGGRGWVEKGSAEH